MRKIVLATKNEGKIREMKMALSELPIEILTLKDFPSLLEVEEDGKDFFTNAYKKARTIADFTGLPAIADDSGLLVDSLGGLPGARSARFAGEKATDEDNIQKLLKELEHVPDDKRGARFYCVIVYCEPGGQYVNFEGKWEGVISRDKKGKEGFGYDPVFFLPERGCTVAELAPEEKNKYSHRGQALEALKNYLFTKMKGNGA